MADAVITLKARKKMVQARAGAITLPPIVGMVSVPAAWTKPECRWRLPAAMKD